MSDPTSTADPAVESQKPPVTRWGLVGLFAFGIILLLTIDNILASATLPPTRMIGDYHGDWLQKARDIGIAMYQYSTDHGGKYPDGKSSTEVFQILLNQGYVHDPDAFYIWLPGKIQGTRGQALKPENVCYDVTGGVDANDSDLLPLVFMTGFKVTYAPGSTAIPLIKPYPILLPPRTWSEWLSAEPKFSDFNDPGPGIAVTYKSNYVYVVEMTMSGDSIGTIPHFIDPVFDPKGKVFRQLTPDGPLPQ